jgi:hypothetical protein
VGAAYAVHRAVPQLDDSAVTMSDYIGVYVFMEKIKVGPNRVDIA